MTEKTTRDRDTYRDPKSQREGRAKPLEVAAVTSPVVPDVSTADEALRREVEAAGPASNPDVRFKQLQTNSAFAELMEDLAATSQAPPASDRAETAEMALSFAPRSRRITDRVDTLTAEDHRKRNEIYNRLTTQFSQALYAYQRSLLAPEELPRFREVFPNWDTTYPLLFEHGVRLWQGERYRRAQADGAHPNDIKLSNEEFGELFKKHNPVLHRRMTEGWLPETLPSTSLEPRPAAADSQDVAPKPIPQERVVITERARPSAQKKDFKGEPTLLRMPAVTDGTPENSHETSTPVGSPDQDGEKDVAPIAVPEESHGGKIVLVALVLIVIAALLFWPKHGLLRGNDSTSETQKGDTPLTTLTGEPVNTFTAIPQPPPLPPDTATAEPSVTASAVVLPPTARTGKPGATGEPGPATSSTPVPTSSAKTSPFFESNSGSAATGFFDRP